MTPTEHAAMLRRCADELGDYIATAYPDFMLQYARARARRDAELAFVARVRAAADELDSEGDAA